jgi:hypothetical protein
MTSTRIITLQQAIAPVRARLTAHPLYNAVQDPVSLCTFMEHHVYAVWDFMSLLKSLQQTLTCTAVPWIPRGNANTRYLINEIVTGEESDVDEQGRRTSHFELYLRAMRQAGASTDAIDRFIAGLKTCTTIGEALTTASPDAVRPFLHFTFDTIATGEPHRIAAVFTFGREDLIPDLFLPLVRKLDQETPGTLTIFRYYLERHIEVDGDHHSHLAMSMVEELCGDDDQKWATATRAAQAALESRIALWDAVLAALAVSPRRDQRENRTAMA